MTDTTVVQTQYVTVAEVASGLRVAKMTVYRLIHKGILRAERINAKTYRIPRDAFDEYLRSLDAEARNRQEQARAAAVIPGQTEITE